MSRAAILMLLALAACGVDGDPVPPSEADAVEPGISLSGSVDIGVSGTLSP